jgi:hypothetical protein
MYTNENMCPELKPSEICVVVEKYNEGLFERKFHEHIPEVRLSDESLRDALRALVLMFEGLQPMTVLRSFLNRRGKDPSVYTLMWHTSRPEPGVLRLCCGTNTHAWADRVIAKSSFRAADSERRPSVAARRP